MVADREGRIGRRAVLATANTYVAGFVAEY
jgi:hypothetical protein